MKTLTITAAITMACFLLIANMSGADEFSDAAARGEGLVKVRSMQQSLNGGPWKVILEGAAGKRIGLFDAQDVAKYIFINSVSFDDPLMPRMLTILSGV